MDLLALERAAIVAPAGCGKTQLVVDAVERHRGRRPILVLTHTNAGVAALRIRLQRAGVPARAFRVTTLDGFARGLVARFPNRAGVESHLLTGAKPVYEALRDGAIRLLAGGSIDRVLRASYDRIVVDEYQDCSTRQHQLVRTLSEQLPTCVLGDPMQAIFGFVRADPLPPWSSVVDHFPVVGELDRPWRWDNAGTSALGHWLLAARRLLERRQPIDLTSAPAELQWVRLAGGPQDHEQCRSTVARACRESEGSVVVLCDSRSRSRRIQLARQVPGAGTVEPVDLQELMDFAAKFPVEGANALNHLLDFAVGLMTGVDASRLLKRVETLVAGRSRQPPSDVETAAVRLRTKATPEHARALLECLHEAPGTRLFRLELYRATVDAFTSWRCGPDEGLERAAARVRERRRLTPRSIPRRAIGSTLLLKGLEAETAVVVDAAPMDARHLYVALTRGSKRVVVCSPQARLPM